MVSTLSISRPVTRVPCERHAAHVLVAASAPARPADADVVLDALVSSERRGRALHAWRHRSAAAAGSPHGGRRGRHACSIRWSQQEMGGRAASRPRRRRIRRGRLLRSLPHLRARRGRPAEDAVELAARCGAACMTGRGLRALRSRRDRQLERRLVAVARLDHRQIGSAHERVGGRGHGLERDHVVVLGRVELRERVRNEREPDLRARRRPAGTARPGRRWVSVAEGPLAERAVPDPRGSRSPVGSPRPSTSRCSRTDRRSATPPAARREAAGRGESRRTGAGRPPWGPRRYLYRARRREAPRRSSPRGNGNTAASPTRRRTQSSRAGARDRDPPRGPRRSNPGSHSSARGSEAVGIELEPRRVRIQGDRSSSDPELEPGQPVRPRVQQRIPIVEGRSA